MISWYNKKSTFLHEKQASEASVGCLYEEPMVSKWFVLNNNSINVNMKTQVAPFTNMV